MNNDSETEWNVINNTLRNINQEKQLNIEFDFAVNAFLAIRDLQSKLNIHSLLNVKVFLE